MKKKLIALLMAIVLMGGVTGIRPAQAAQYSEEEVASKILYVKEILNIGDEYSNFSQNVWENNGNQEWSFSWNDSNYEKSIYVNMDGDNHISYFSSYRDYYLEDSVIPAEFAETYEKTAQAFIKKIAPECVDHIKLDITSLNYYGNSFSYVYVRFENGYEMPDNSLRVTVDHVRNEVVSFDSSWDYKVKISKPGKIISKSEAASKLSGKLDMELQYIYRWNDDKEEAFLAYVPSSKYFSVDAVSGKIYKEKNYYYANGYDEEETMAAGEAGYVTRSENKTSATLSDAEIKKVNEIANLISKEDAIAVVTSNKDLLLESSIKQTSAYLSTYKDSYFWRITMSDPRPVDYNTNDYYRTYVSATVDAKDGRLLDFHSTVRDYYDYEDAQNVEFKFSKNECIKKFEKFAKSLEPERFAQTKKTSDNGGYTIYYDYNKGEPIYGGRYLTYTRLVNNIPFYRDSISGSVDRVTGKIYDYSVDWSDDIEFPSPEKAISEKAAFDKYLESDEFVLKYELTSTTISNEETYESVVETKSRLCYVTDIKASYVDAFTGTFLNYDGEEYKPVNNNKTFTDISGHKYEKEIRFISQLLSSVEGDKFEPDAYVTNKFIFEVFENMWYFPRQPQNLKNNDKFAKREDVAAILVEALGYKDMSELDIYAVKYKDAEKISKNKLGAVAIACGFELFNVKKNGKFKPSSRMTRGEFAYSLAKAVVVSQRRYY